MLTESFLNAKTGYTEPGDAVSQGSGHDVNPAKLEYEITHNLAKTGSQKEDTQNLLSILNHPLIVNNASLPYRDHLEESVAYYQASEYRHALVSRPVTWYMDTKDQGLREKDVNFRIRINPYVPQYCDLAIKGKAQAFNGPGGLLRHEHEESMRGFVIDPLVFIKDPISRTLIEPALGQDIYHYFATDVKRFTVGIPFKEHAKGPIIGVAEAAFDIITYVIPGDTEDNPLIKIYDLHQIEVEYANPESEGHRHIAATMNLQQLSKGEIEKGLHYATDLILGAAKDLNIALLPSDDSKGCIGYRQLAEHQDRERAAPPSPQFPAYCPKPFFG